MIRMCRPLRSVSLAAVVRIPFGGSLLSLVLRGAACGLAVVASGTAMAEGLEGRGDLGPAPTGLAVTAFSALDPLQRQAGHRDATPESPRTAAGGRTAAWRSLSPAERAVMMPIDADLFPLTRRAVPLLVPDAADVTSTLPVPAGAMTGPSVGVPWRIPGYAP